MRYLGWAVTLAALLACAVFFLLIVIMPSTTLARVTGGLALVVTIATIITLPWKEN